MRYGLLSIFYFLISLGVGAFQFLNLFYVDFGLSTGQIGALFAIGPLIMIFAQPFWGLLTDYLNSPKSTLFMMIIGASIIAILFPVATSFKHLMILNVLYFFFQSSIQPIADATTMAVLKDSTDFGKIRLWGSLGYAVGVITIGSLLDTYGLYLLFILNAFILMLTLLFIFRLPVEQVKKRKFKMNEAMALFKNKSFLLFLLFSFLVHLTVHANNSFYAIFLQNLGATITLVGFALLIKSILEIPFFAMSKKLMKRFSYPVLLSLVAGVYGIRWLILGFSSNMEILIGSQILLSLSFSIQYFVSVAYVDQITPKEYRATGQTFYWAVSLGLGGLVGNILAGFVLIYIDIQTLYIIAGCIALVSIILLWIQPMTSNKITEGG